MGRIMNAIRQSPLEFGAAALGVIAIVMAGYAFLTTQAAGTFATADASKATVSGGASIVSDTTAANGKAVKFADPALAPSVVNLDDPAKKEIAMKLVSSAENSSLDWKAQYAYIEDIGDGRGYTAGIIGFCTGCGDLLKMVQYYTKLKPDNVLAKYIPALQKIGSFNPTHAGLDPNFTKDWKTAAKDTLFQQAQNDERDRVYFNPAVSQGKTDGLHALGQFAYYDALVVHGPGNDAVSFGGIRAAALKKAKTPAQGGDEKTYINAFLDARNVAMKSEEAHEDTSRVDTAQRKFLNEGNFSLTTPLSWSVYGDKYSIP